MSSSRLTSGDYQAFYRLGLLPDNSGLRLDLSPESWKFLRSINPAAPILKSFEADGLPPFDFKNQIGFGGVLGEEIPFENGWSSLVIPYPVIKDSSVESGMRVTLLRNSLHILFFALGRVEETTLPAKEKAASQLWLVESLDARNGMNCASIWVSLSPLFVATLAKLDERACESVKKAMIKADALMWPETVEEYKRERPHGGVSFREHLEFHRHDFRVTLRHHEKKVIMLHLSVPGNACGLDPEHTAMCYGVEEGGYRLVPHNIDSSLQQFTLLAGIVRLGEIVRLKL